MPRTITHSRNSRSVFSVLFAVLSPKISPRTEGLLQIGYPCVALSALALLFLRLPRAALRAETGLSLALGYFDIAPSALNPERRSYKSPKSRPALKRRPIIKASLP